VCVVELICDGDECCVPPASVAGFVPSDEQDCGPSWIKRKQNAQVVAGFVGTKLFHVVVSRAFDVIDERPTKNWAKHCEPPYDGIERFLEILVKRIPPGNEFVGDFYVPHYQTNLILARTNGVPLLVEYGFAMPSV
jgi:hypothetical protein